MADAPPPPATAVPSLDAPVSGTEPVLALDVGGTKLAAGVVDPDGRVLASARTATPHGTDVDAEGLWLAVAGLLDRVVTDAGTPAYEGVGVGCGGPMQWPQGKVSPLNIPAWRDFPLRDRVAEYAGGRPVRLHNDAVTMAVGEHWRGAGRGCRNLLGMVVSTGVGGGLVLGDHLVDGASGNAGHVGHVVVDPEGPECVCGGRGCLEAVARGPALATWALEQGWEPSAGRHPGPPTARDLADDARAGHEVAVAAMQRAGRAVGLAVASAAHLCDLEVVTIGGGLSQAGPLLFDPVEDTLHRYARMDFSRHVRVVPAALGQEAGLVGAAALVLAGDRYWNGV